MVPEQILNAWGEPVEPDDADTNPYWVPEDQRQVTDEDEGANALTDPLTGEVDNDLDGWKPGDPV